MARPKGSKDGSKRIRYTDETKQVMAAVVAEHGATKARKVLQKRLGKKTPSVATLCNIAKAAGVPLSRGAEIDLDGRDVLAALINELGLTGARNALNQITVGNKPAMKVPSLVTLAKVAAEYGIELTRGRRKEAA